MAKTMVETVNSEAYAKASGAMLDATLTMSAPLREGQEKSMLQVLQQLSLPSKQDIVALAERFTNLEIRLDDMDAKLDRILAGVLELSRSAQPVLPAAAPDTLGATAVEANPVDFEAAPPAVEFDPSVAEPELPAGESNSAGDEPAPAPVEASPADDESHAPAASPHLSAPAEPAARPRKSIPASKTARKGAK
jgi:polyhydroxyalkanoate synthesis regulator phasin